MDTKQRIIKQAIEVFNESGFGAVNLFEIAKLLDVSRGNVTYHFKDKDLLLEEITNQIWLELSESRATNKNIPSFQNLHHDVQLYYKMQVDYSFIFQDNQVLKHPLVAPKIKELGSKTITDIKAAIAFSIQLGNMKKEPVSGVYDNLALTSWILMFFWSSQETARGTQAGKDGEKVIWSLLLPHLTEKGLASFNKYFGEDYTESFGDPFDMNTDAYFTF